MLEKGEKHHRGLGRFQAPVLVGGAVNGIDGIDWIRKNLRIKVQYGLFNQLNR